MIELMDGGERGRKVEVGSAGWDSKSRETRVTKRRDASVRLGWGPQTIGGRSPGGEIVKMALRIRSDHSDLQQLYQKIRIFMAYSNIFV